MKPAKDWVNAAMNLAPLRDASAAVDGLTP